MRKTTLYSMGFIVAALSAIMYFSMTKTIEISNVSHNDMVMSEVEEPPVAEEIQEISTCELKFAENSDVDYICIPLPEKTGTDDIVIENHYMDHKLYVGINDALEQFYLDNNLTGNRENVIKGTYEVTNSGIRLCLDMKGLYEYKSVLDNGSLYITLYTPREMFEKIVVIDPIGGGADTGVSDGVINEKDISLSIAAKLRILLDNDDSNIKVYYTRLDDVNPTKEARVSLANDSKADMYIRIGADSKEDTSVYGVTSLYNGDYFIPGFGNVELSDIMETQVVTAIKGKALGLSECSVDDYEQIHSCVPTTSIMVGCVSNHQEASLLGRDDYLDKVAEGIYEGIKAVYDNE